MGKAVAIGEIAIVLKEVIDSASNFFTESIPGNFCEMMDDLAFLTSGFLKLNSSGEFLDNTKNVADAVMGLSNLVIWGILLFYVFRSLFAYFLSKKTDMPWKFFIRIIIFGILANTSFFICYTAVFFAENSTAYIREYVGKKDVSFCLLEEYIEPEIIENDEESDIYTMDVLVSVFIYFSSFFTAICLAGRYIFIKVLILVSPIFFIFGGFKISEKLFYKWCKIFLSLIFLQIFFSISLAVVGLTNESNDVILQILVCGMLFIFCRNILKFLNLSY